MRTSLSATPSPVGKWAAIACSLLNPLLIMMPVPGVEIGNCKIRKPLPGRELSERDPGMATRQR